MSTQIREATHVCAGGIDNPADCEPCEGDDGCGNYYDEEVCLGHSCDWMGWEHGPGCGGSG